MEMFVNNLKLLSENAALITQKVIFLESALAQEIGAVIQIN